MDTKKLNYGRFTVWLGDRNASGAQLGEKPELPLDEIVQTYVLQARLPASEKATILAHWKEHLPAGRETYPFGLAKCV
jgi:hypothetical protein